ncbi:IclR family transcriptional regulator [Luedemannella helvata]|uniref:IclR family transcriptional regulator n=1 Tax=Luedemannella helvata TaxID=349315 RepID=A0ABN2KWX5_9ACTN
MAATDSTTNDSALRTVSGVERALDVLMLFAESDQPTLGVSEIGRQMGLSKAVIHRILTTLCSRRLIEVDENTRRYVLGPAALALGRAFLDRVDIRDLAREPMRRLSRFANETSTLSIRTGNHRIYVDQVAPARDVRMTVQIGHPFPLHAGSSSKAFLAFMTPAEQEAYLTEAAPLTAMTDHTLVDASHLRDELRITRERGYAVSFGERQAGAGSVAAPILDHDRVPVAVLSICGPVERIRGRIDQLSAALLDEVRGISDRLGGGGL